MLMKYQDRVKGVDGYTVQKLAVMSYEVQMI